MTHQDPYAGVAIPTSTANTQPEMVMVDPYEALGKNFRVNHPTQPKTQVERWREEIEENQNLFACCLCDLYEEETCDKCKERRAKIAQLQELIFADHEKNKTYLNRHAVGSFPDDYKDFIEVEDKCTNCFVRKNGQVIQHHKGKCTLCGKQVIPYKVTLLDKIKKLLWKRH